MYKRHPKIIIPLTLLLLLFTKSAFAFFSFADVPDLILGGIEEAVGPLFKVVITVFIVFYFSHIFLTLFVTWFNTIATTQGTMISNLDVITRIGWDFFAGISNLFLILIFLAIAIAFIFKIEAFQLKKALPKLIIVALLINFSLVFVYALIDLSQVLYNTVVPSEGFLTLAETVFLSPGKSLLGTIIAWLVATLTSLAIPYANAFIQVAFGLAFSVTMLPNLVIWLVQGLFTWVLVFLFLTFCIVFLARVIILQLLAILSPLALLSLVIPNTKKLWDMWLKTLIEWLLSGILVLAFLQFGLKALSVFKPAGVSIVGVGGLANLPSYLFYFFFATIYMGVVLMIAKKTLPKGAQDIINAGKGLGKMVYGAGIKPMGKFFKSQGSGIQESLAKTEQGKKLGNWLANVKSPQSKVGKFFATPFVRASNKAGETLRGDQAKESMIQNIEANKGKFEKIKTPAMLMNEFQSAKSDAERIAILSTANNKGSTFFKPFEEAFKEDENGNLLNPALASSIKNAAATANKIGAVPDAESIGRRLLHTKDTPEKRDALLREMKFKDLSEDDKTHYGSISEKLIAETKGDKIKGFNKDLFKDKEVLNTTLKHWSGDQVGTAAREHQRDFLDNFQEHLTTESGQEVNPVLYNYLLSNGARNLGLRMGPTMEAEGLKKITMDKFQSANNDDERAEILLSSIKSKNTALFKSFEDAFKEDERGTLSNPTIANNVKSAVSKLNELAANDMAEDISRRLLHTKNTPEKRDALLKEMGFNDLSADDKKRYSSISEKLIAETKGNDISGLNKDLFKDKGTLDAISKHWSGEQVVAAAKAYQQDFLGEFQKHLNKLYISESYGPKINPTLRNYLSGSEARSLGLELEIKPEAKRIIKP